MKNKPKMIFDFDGTLVDSMPCWGGKMLSVLDELGVKYPENMIEILTPLGDRGSAEYFIREFGVSLSVQQLIDRMDVFATPGYRDTILAKETVAEKLTEWKGKGYSLNVLTASPHRMLDVCLKRLGLYGLFDHVWSCDDFGTTKGDVSIYQQAAALLHTTPAHCLFFDDNLHALATAKAAGMQVVGVYDASADRMQDAIQKLCPQYIFRFADFTFEEEKTSC